MELALQIVKSVINGKRRDITEEILPPQSIMIICISSFYQAISYRLRKGKYNFGNNRYLFHFLVNTYIYIKNSR